MRVSTIKKRTFKSRTDFFKRLFDIFKGPTILMTWWKVDKVLREKVLLTLSISNNCYGWVSAHSALGKRLGITQDKINDLITLNPANFKYREWILLKYVQDWGFSKGVNPSRENHQDYYLQYTKKERAYILKMMRVMLFSNYLNNHIKNRGWRSDIEGVVPDDFYSIGQGSDFSSKN